MKLIVIVFALFLSTATLQAQHEAYFTIKGWPVSMYRSFMAHCIELMNGEPNDNPAYGACDDYVDANYPITIHARKLRVSIIDTVDGIVTIKYQGRKYYTVPEALSTLEYTQPTLKIYEVRIGILVATSSDFIADLRTAISKGPEKATYFKSLHPDDILATEYQNNAYLLDVTDGIAHIHIISNNDTFDEGVEVYTLFKWLKPVQ